MTAPPISIIVPTAGRPAELAATLSSLCTQTFPPRDYEILVVENGPEQGARLVAARVAAEHPDHALHFLQEPVPGLLAGRHRGALEARSGVLVFVDDDIDADRGWLAAIADAFADPRVDLVGGPSLPRFESPPPGWLAEFWWTPPDGVTACGHLSLIDYGPRTREVDPNHVWGLNFSIRRQVLFDFGGFHPDCLPEELQYLQGDGETGLTLKMHAAGVRAHYEPRVLVHHVIKEDRLTPHYFRSRAFYQGVCDSYTAIRRQSRLAAKSREGISPRVIKDWWRDRFTRAWRNWRGIRSGLERSPDQKRRRDGETNSVDAHEVKRSVELAYENGREFHQSVVASSSELLDWVLRENYWDYRLPSLRSSPIASLHRRFRPRQ